MKKNDFKKPALEDLKSGKILPIYQDYKAQKKLLGYARLNYKVESLQEETPYIIAEIGGEGKKEPDTIIWSFQRWNITYVDPWEYDKTMSDTKRMKYIYQKDFKTNWNIAYFVTVDTSFSSFYERSFYHDD